MTDDVLNEMTFYGINEWVEKHLDIPAPAIKELPQWYLDSYSYFHGNTLELGEGGANNTIKHCMPVLDIMSTGWIQKTWCDVHIRKDPKDGSLTFQQQPGGPEIMGYRDTRVLGKMPIPKGFLDISFLWRRPWRMITPPGYSTMITHPFYHDDLPFRTVSAVMDTDVYHGQGKTAFLLRDDFEGLIPKGTPMYQIIPFKKESWKASKGKLTEEIEDKFEHEAYTIRSVTTGAYKKEYWKRPDFSNEKCPIDHEGLVNQDSSEES